MLYIELAHAAQLHRETYITVINGLLQEPASKRQFAKTVGITPQYLSYLLNPYDRLPGAALARKMVDALPLDADARKNLYEHLLLAREQQGKAHQFILQDFGRTDVATHLAIIQRAEQQAVFATDPRQANIQQQLTRSVGTLLLSQLIPTVYPFEFAQLSLWLSNIEGILNRHPNALYYAKQAHMVLSHTVRTDFKREERERLDELAVNALRCEGVAYHNLKLEHEAYERCCTIEHMQFVRNQPLQWLPHLYRDKINAYSEKPRFSIRAVEEWAKQGKIFCEHSQHTQAPLWSFMLDRSLAQAYIHYGNLKKAKQVLKTLLGEVDQLPIVGPLHRVLFLKTYAETLWREGAQEAWQATLTTAITLALAAGLNDQMSKLKKQYGDAINPLLPHNI